MTKKPCRGYRSRCPINIALELFGDRWSLLIIRDLMFLGTGSFQGFLDSSEKISTNILADRLAKLEAADIVAKRTDAEDARRVHYSLNDKGLALAPVLVEIILWAADHEDTAAPPEMIAAIKADRRHFIAGLGKGIGRANQEPG